MNLRDAVFRALGQASMCWDPIPAGVFDDVRAARIGEELIKAIDAARPEPPPEKARTEISNIAADTSRTWQPSVQSGPAQPVFGFARGQ